MFILSVVNAAIFYECGIECGVGGIFLMMPEQIVDNEEKSQLYAE